MSFLSSFFGARRTVSINGKTFEGENVRIENDRVFIDGKEVEVGTASRTINVVIQGDVKELETTSGDVTVKGNTERLSTASGDVSIGGDVTGNLSTVSGDVEVEGAVHGNVSTVSGDVRSGA